MLNLQWSPSEKVIARRVFNHALDKELQELIDATKRMAAKIEEAPELWKMESWLSKRRQEIDRKYDFRYSVLPWVFAALLGEGRISEEDLRGLDAKKISMIVSVARM